MLSLLRSRKIRRWNPSNKSTVHVAAPGVPPEPRLRRCALALACLPLAAQAAPYDGLQPYAALSYAYEDNLLRVPEGQPAFDNTLGDSMRSGIAGLNFDKDYGRQHVHADAKVTKVDFNHFRQLNYNGKDVLGRWNWQLGNDLSGTAQASYSQVLAPYTDLYSSERNLRVQRQQMGEAVWRFAPTWRLRVSSNRDVFSYDLLSQRGNNRTQTLNDAEVDYLATTGSWVGLVARKVKGDYENKLKLNNLLIDNSFDQDELKASLYWVLSGSTAVTFQGGWTKRSHVFFTDRDAKGQTGRLTVRYTPRGSVQLTAALWREFAALESSTVSYSLNNGGSLGAVWNATGKLQATANYTRDRRDYTPNAGLISTVALRDTLVTSSAGLTYLPLQSLQVSLSGYHQSRTGIAALRTGAYKANGVTLSATLQF